MGTVKNVALKAESFIREIYARTYDLNEVWNKARSYSDGEQEQLMHDFEHAKEIAGRVKDLYDHYMTKVNNMIENQIHVCHKYGLEDSYNPEHMFVNCLEAMYNNSEADSSVLLATEQAISGDQEDTDEQILTCIYESTHTIRDAADKLLDVCDIIIESLED